MNLDAADPLALDRDLARIAGAWRRWRRALRRGEGLDGVPFAGHRDLTGRAGFDAVSALHVSDPLREPLLGWIHRLMEQRIDATALSALTSELHIEQRVIDQPEHARLTLADLERRALLEPARRAAWLDAFVKHAPPHSAAVSLLWERRTEIARRLGHDDFDALDPVARDAARAAEAWLTETDDAAAEWRTPSLPALLEAALGGEADRGWPAHLSPRSLVEPFRETRVFDNFDLDPGELPRAVAASSFLRALARLGAAFADAARPRTVPFVIACDPRGLRRFTLGALFGTLPLSRAFSVRALSLSPAQARDQARVLARVVLLHTRAQALRVRLRASALGGRKAFENAFEEQVERVFGVIVPRAIAGSLFRLHVDDAQRFAGILLAARDAERMIEAHDEDWYRNPRAADQLRSEAALSPETRVPPEALAAGASSLSRVLREAIG